MTRIFQSLNMECEPPYMVTIPKWKRLWWMITGQLKTFESEDGIMRYKEINGCKVIVDLTDKISLTTRGSIK